MKRILLNMMAAAVMAVAVSGCGDDAPLMTLTTENDKVEISLSGTGNAKIDWGDGNREKGKLLDFVESKYSHVYTGKTARSIKISGNDIKKLSCKDNALTALDISQNQALRTLDCSDNRLTELDVSSNTWLWELFCSNNQIKSMDVSRNLILNKFDCRANQLSVSALNAMFGMLREDKSGVSSINMYNNPGTGGCDRSIATQKGWLINSIITLTTNYERAYIWLAGSGYATIDWGDGSKLETVELLKSERSYIHKYPRKSNCKVTVSGSGIKFFRNDDPLKSLDVSQNPSLEHLICQGSQLMALDVSKNPALKELQCQYNNLTRLDVSKNIALTHLFCDGNQLTELDLSNNTALMALTYNFNRIKHLDLSKNTALKRWGGIY